MRRSTFVYLGVFLVSAGVFVGSVCLIEPSDEVHLAVWGQVQEVGELESQVVAPINERNDSFRVRVVPSPADYQTKLTTMIAGQDPPELFYLSLEHIPALAAQGALLDITDLVAADASPVTDLSLYYPQVLERYRYNGRLYGLPWIAQPVVLYCNVRHFREAGVDLPDGSWRWADFVSAARRLTRDTDGDGQTDRWGFVLNGWPPVSMWIWQNGGRIVDAETGTLRLTEPAAIAALDEYAGLIHRHHVAPPPGVVAEYGLAEMFKSGRVAMFMGGAADDLDRLEGLDVLVAEVPAGPTGIRATAAWTAGLHISARTRRPEVVWRAYKQVLDGIQHWKVPAPRRDLAERLEEFEPRKTDAADAIRRSMEYMRLPVVHTRQVEWDTAFAEEIIEPLLQTGQPAGPLVRERAPRLRAILEGAAP